MNRPKVVEYKAPKHIKDYPLGPGHTAGHLTQKNDGWRTFRPVIDKELCNSCLRCYLVCPDGTIFRKDDKVDVDYDFCKGCGVCAHECNSGAIKMVKEEK